MLAAAAVTMAVPEVDLAEKMSALAAVVVVMALEKEDEVAK